MEIPLDDPSKFSYWVASYLPLTTQFRQQILETTQTSERLKLTYDLVHQDSPPWTDA